MRTTPRGAFLIAVFNGDPAGPGGGDPQQRDRSGLNSLQLAGGPFAIAEAQFHLPLAGAQVRLGSWWLGRKVPSQALGQSPGAGSISPMQDGSWGAYGIADFDLVKRSDTVISGFVRVAAAPGDRNLVSAYADAGIAVPGSSWGQSKDQLGLAVSWSGIGRAARALDARAVAAGDLAFGRDKELVAELTYQQR
jgi:porin